MNDSGSTSPFRSDAGLTDEGILEHLKSRVAPDLELRPDEIARLALDSPVAEGLQLDSLRQVMLLARLEEDYGVSFALDDIEVFERITTVSDLVRLVRERALAARS